MGGNRVGEPDNVEIIFKRNRGWPEKPFLPFNVFLKAILE